MRGLRTTLPFVLVILAACATARDPEPESVLTMRFPVISATSPVTQVRIDQDGRVEQAIRLPDNQGWKVYSSSIRDDHVSRLMTAALAIPWSRFRQRQPAARQFTIVAETADGRLELSYDDATIPCTDEVFHRFLAVWSDLNELLPERLPESELPRCGIPRAA